MVNPLNRERSVIKAINEIESSDFHSYTHGYDEYGDPLYPPLCTFLPSRKLSRKMLRAIAHYGGKNTAE
jgi:hypothetical protein